MHYFKCFHGSWKIVKITKGMKGNLSRSFFLLFVWPTRVTVCSVNKLSSAHFCLCELLNKRDTPPTPEELAITDSTKAMDPQVAKNYLDQFEVISGDIQNPGLRYGYALQDGGGV